MEGKLHLPRAEQQICQKQDPVLALRSRAVQLLQSSTPLAGPVCDQNLNFLEVRKCTRVPAPSGVLPFQSDPHLSAFASPCPGVALLTGRFPFESITFLRQKLQPKCHCSQTATVEIHRAAQLGIANLSGSA